MNYANQPGRNQRHECDCVASTISPVTEALSFESHQKRS